MYYIYNSVKLPALPEWDKETYPYSVIRLVGTVYYMYLSKTKPYHSIRTNGTVYIMVGGGADEDLLQYYYDGGELHKDWDFVSKDNGVYFSPDALLWTNTDIYKDDGTLYLAASDPLPVGKPITDPLSFAMGWQLGQRLRMRTKKPIGYSYNGTVLPELPEVEGYAVIRYVNNSGAYVLDVSAFPIRHTTDLFAVLRVVAPSENYILSDGVWVHSGTYGEDRDQILGGSANTAVWANHDVLKNDESVYLSASDPVPVYGGDS